MNPNVIAAFLISLQLLLFGFVSAVNAESDVDIGSVLAELAKENDALGKVLKATAAERLHLQIDRRQAESIHQRIEADYQDARETLVAIGRLDKGLGPLFRQHYESLPDAEHYEKRIESRSHEKAEAGLRRMLRREESRRFSNVDLVVHKRIGNLASATADVSAEQEDALRELIVQRQQLTVRGLAEDEQYLQTMMQLDNIENTLLGTLEEYDEFLRQQLWWLRGAQTVSIGEITRSLDDVRDWTASSERLDAVSRYWQRLSQSVWMWLAVLIAAGFFWKRQTLVKAINARAQRLGKISTDRLSDTVVALCLSMIAAAPLPFLVLVLGWQLGWSDQQGRSVSGPVTTLLHLSGVLYSVQVLRWSVVRGGLAEAHFKWPEQALSRLRKVLARFTVIYVVTMFGIGLFHSQLIVGSIGLFARVAFVVLQIALAGLIYSLLHYRKGVFRSWYERRTSSVLRRLYVIGFWFLLQIPIWIALEMLLGYVHSSIVISSMLISTLGLSIVLALSYSMARRWLLVTHRRLALEAALERRRSALLAREAKAAGIEEEVSAELVLEEPQINLTELSDDTRALMQIVTLVVGVIGLYFVWMPLAPALKLFDSVNLWTHTVTVDGEVQRLPTTLADIVKAVLIVLATVFLINRLPSMLKIILLQRSNLSESSRYTFTKLTSYAVFTLGALLALHAIGASWSQLQWLVAALGVGIGFGLQEVVANFICGLIILFERPIRIGDVITVDNTTGIVTKIRIRATTIRDWDRKELLVPNKDLITGRVLNWSLSDELTRIVITVGIAYNSDVDKALALMQEAADEHDQALTDPAPLMSFDEFGDHALILTMRVYVSAIGQRIKTVTDLRKAIHEKFREAGISIAYPQRDVHFDTTKPFRITLEKADA